eukprot:4833458-Prymnesium_polylepis.1
MRENSSSSSSSSVSSVPWYELVVHADLRLTCFASLRNVSRDAGRATLQHQRGGPSGAGQPSSAGPSGPTGGRHR